MNKKIIVLIIVIFFLCGCGLLTFTPTQENSEADDLIYYKSLSFGKYKISDILVYSSLWERIHENAQVADEIVGDICYFTGDKDENIIGGVIPIRDEEKQKFYYGTGYLADLEVKGNYYPIFSFETGDEVSDTCFIICRLWKNWD